VPEIPPPTRKRNYVVTRQAALRELVATVHAQVRIAGKQRLVIQRRDIVGTRLEQRMAVATGGNNRVDLDNGTALGMRVIAAVNLVQQAAIAVGDLPQII